MASPEPGEAAADATQPAAAQPASRADVSSVRASVPIYRPRNHRRRAVVAAVLSAVITAVLVWVVLAVIL